MNTHCTTLCVGQRFVCLVVAVLLAIGCAKSPQPASPEAPGKKATASEQAASKATEQDAAAKKQQLKDQLQGAVRRADTAKARVNDSEEPLATASTSVPVAPSLRPAPAPAVPTPPEEMLSKIDMSKAVPLFSDPAKVVYYGPQECTLDKVATKIWSLETGTASIDLVGRREVKGTLFCGTIDTSQVYSDFVLQAEISRKTVRGDISFGGSGPDAPGYFLLLGESLTNLGEVSFYDPLSGDFALGQARVAVAPGVQRREQVKAAVSSQTSYCLTLMVKQRRITVAIDNRVLLDEQLPSELPDPHGPIGVHCWLYNGDGQPKLDFQRIRVARL